MLQADAGASVSVWPGLPLEIQAIKTVANDETGDAETLLMCTHMQTGWLNAKSVKLPEAALDYFHEKSANTGDGESKWKFAEALTHAHLQKHQEAVEIFNKLLEGDPENISYLNERAGSLMQLARFETLVMTSAP
ncbi:MAG: hypothetical protein R3C03_23070 [Pirellulaceae bacterium]